MKNINLIFDSSFFGQFAGFLTAGILAFFGM